MSQTISSSQPIVQKASVKPTSASPVKPASGPVPGQDRATVSAAEQQSGADPGYLSGIAQAWQDYSGVSNRTLGTTGDVAAASVKGDFVSAAQATSFKPSQSWLAGKIDKAGPAIGAAGAIINTDQGLINVKQGKQKFSQGESVAGKSVGAAQMAQGGTQLAAAGTGVVNLASQAAAKVAPQAIASNASAVAGATGKVLAKGLGPAVAGLEATKNGAEAIQAYQNGDENKALEKGYLSVTKGGGAAAMAFANPVGVTVGAGVVIGTSIAEVLNQTECVQNAQRQVVDWITSPVQDLPPPSQAERRQYREQWMAHKAR